ncbi:MAG: Hsp70 family protein, partial [Treponema sp.]|nr:Hsp70 family protein [Treponema sp.]
MAATIGIKIANGDFYSIMEENTTAKKRLVLTTVHNNQKSVQIDLYKSYTKSMADALYIGSLVVENLSLKAKGEPSIELVISATAEGVIAAESFDLGNPSGEHQQLSLHLKSFEEDAGDYSDFDIEESGGGLYEKSAAIRDAGDEPGKFP